ncbi:DUF5681 domain-containing protein [Sphingomonas sp. So64.6b]|uniref:DUF5681 domain-containing protein n=1 Tax=Sphingomonas sp. So64.6b TaxID=2997354 RepID=UPI001AEDC076|nr:DUF5681 domain-containing protein [Sphingomonas sp. So64.6b]
MRAETAGAVESAASCDDAVGHGKPPREHQFKKGNRASVEGKRRKVKAAEEVVPQLPNESVHGMLMAEAMRMVRVKAGGRLVEIPAMQAAFREIAMKAARGNRLAAATLARLIMQSEAAEARAAALAPVKPAAPSWAELEARRARAFQSEEFKAAEEYKEVWTQVLTKTAKLKAELTAPVPHPDEVRIGRVQGTADWPGAQPDEMLSLDGLAATHAELQADLPVRRPAIEAMVESYDKAAAWCEWFALNDIRDLIADHLPERYAGQVQADTRAAEVRARDRSLRSMAEHDRRQHERRIEMDAAAAARAKAARALALSRDWSEIRRDGDEEAAGDGTERIARVAKPVSKITGPARTVAEASAYRAAWLEVLKATEEMEYDLKPVPPPEDVIINAAAKTVTYRVPPEAGQGATLNSMRATLATLKELAMTHEGAMGLHAEPYHMFIAQRRRDNALKLCAVIERHLAGVEAGRG